MQWKPSQESKTQEPTEEIPELPVPNWIYKERRKKLAQQCETEKNCQKNFPIGEKKIIFEGNALNISTINRQNPAVQKLLENLEGMKNFSVGNEKIFVEGKNLKFFLKGVGSCLVTPTGWNILQKSPDALAEAEKFIAQLEGKNPEQIQKHFSSSHTKRTITGNKEYEPITAKKISVVETKKEAEGDQSKISKEQFQEQIRNEKEGEKFFKNCEVTLSPGTYTGPFVIRSPGMKIRGSSGVKFTGGKKNSPCIKMAGPGQEISEVSFTNDSQTTAIESKGYDNKIENCHISEVERGIVVHGSNTLIKNNIIDGFYDDGMFISNSYATIIGNHIKNLKSGDNTAHHDGIQFSAGTDRDRYNPNIKNPKHTISGTVIAENIIELGENGKGNLQGITSFEGYADGWTIYENTISVNTDHGISINGGMSESKNFIIEKNNFTKARGGKNKPMIKLRPPRKLVNKKWEAIDEFKGKVSTQNNRGTEIDKKTGFDTFF